VTLQQIDILFDRRWPRLTIWWTWWNTSLGLKFGALADMRAPPEGPSCKRQVAGSIPAVGFKSCRNATAVRYTFWPDMAAFVLWTDSAKTPCLGLDFGSAADDLVPADRRSMRKHPTVSCVGKSSPRVRSNVLTSGW